MDRQSRFLFFFFFFFLSSFFFLGNTSRRKSYEIFDGVIKRRRCATECAKRSGEFNWSRSLSHVYIPVNFCDAWTYKRVRGDTHASCQITISCFGINLWPVSTRIPSRNKHTREIRNGGETDGINPISALKRGTRPESEKLRVETKLCAPRYALHFTTRELYVSVGISFSTKIFAFCRKRNCERKLLVIWVS